MRKYICTILFLVAAPAFASDLRHVEDASLRSVFFIDPQEGWIVGDEGVILHTIDGGKRWERQPTGTRASLRSVQFLTPFVGWAVGREELPYGQGSVGVILFTSDGGLEWKKQLPNTLPGLNQVRFVDAKTGFLCGDGSDQFPFGVFKTTDSGKSWEPVTGPRTTSWLTGDFFDGKSGILAGAWSRLGTFATDGRKIANPEIVTGVWLANTVLLKNKTALAEHADWLAGRDITSVHILGKKTIAVGQGGLILTSASDGKAWAFADAKLPTRVLANLDFHSVHAVKDKVWIAGRPGSVLLHSIDGGATWSFQKTGQALPLHSVFFFDEKTGFAVGDAGTILKSTDGGANWVTLHQGGRRAAVLCVHSRNNDAPVDTLALLGAAEGYLTTSLRITAPDPATVVWGRDQDARRYGAAIRHAGGMAGETLWHFPMPQHLEGSSNQTILAHWNQLHKNEAEDELMRQLVLSLRIWRPSVVISEHPKNSAALSSLLADAMQEAFRRAADPKAFPEQLEQLGLQAWKVRKIYGVRHEASRERKRPEGASLMQDNDEPKERLQATVREFAASAHALLVNRPVPLPKQRSHHLLANIDEQSAPERHWLEGIDHKVGETRRELKIFEKTDAKLASTMLQRRSALAMAENLDDPAQALKLLPPVLDKLPDEHAAQVSFAIASRFAERGQWYCTQEFYLYLVDRAPAHPLAPEAYRWLLKLNTSSEARRRHELKHFAIAEPIGLANKKGPPLVEEKIVKAGHIVGAGNEVLSRSDVREWNKGSFEWSRRLASFGSVHAFDAGTQFCLQSAKRSLGEVAASNSAMDRLRKFVPTGPWHDAARSELWLTDRSQMLNRRPGRARYTEVRPYLDGKFDDACWKDIKPMSLDNSVGDTVKAYTTETMFAFDQEFLYVALRCAHPAGQRIEPVKPRPRDADVDGFDRVSILLDLDRDYSTYYHLEVDQRGCLRDSCWGDRSWNPRWFVAVHSTEAAWQIEAAIPLSELTSERISQQTAWAFNVARILPGRGVQSWSLPADVDPRPEGMSLLMFEMAKARAMPSP